MKIKWKRRLRRRLKRLLDVIKEKGRSWNLKEEALNRALGALAMRDLMGLWQQSLCSDSTDVTKIKSESGLISPYSLVHNYFSENSDNIKVNIFHPS